MVAMAKELVPDARTVAMFHDGGFRDQAFAREEATTEDLPYAQRVAAHLEVDLFTPSRSDPEMILERLTERKCSITWTNRKLRSRSHFVTPHQSATGPPTRDQRSSYREQAEDDIFSGIPSPLLAQAQYWSWIPAPSSAR